ncbi:MAG: GIY-YIG nuclease family protein [Lentimonas sp.]
MKLYLISQKDGWAWYVFTAGPGDLIARSKASKTTTDAARNAAYRKSPDFKKIPEVVFHSTDKLPRWFRNWEKQSSLEESGVLYALTHPSFDGLIKLGFTDKPLEDTIRRQSNLLPIPQPFKLVDKWQVDDGPRVLRELRKKLKDQHGTEKRSFFRITRPKLKRAVEELIK